MSVRLKKRILIAVFIQVLIVIFSLIIFRKLTLLSYINISFCFSFSLLLTALLVYTIQGGFFDVISRSFNYFFSRGDAKRKLEDIPRLSELITFNKKPLLIHGAITGLLMIFSLVLYYFLLS